MKRKIYLEDIPLEQAWGVFRDALEKADRWHPLPAESIPVAGARDRVTAEAVWARISAPHYHACAMDGYALRSVDTVGAIETSPLVLTLIAPGDEIPPGKKIAQEVNTGHQLPLWADAVVMIEHTQKVTDQDGLPGIEIRASLPPWHHVRTMGEDMVATELVLPANQRLRPVDLGALAASGNTVVTVYRRPRVAIIPTGTELVPLEQASGIVAAGQIIEFNSVVLASQVESWGGSATRWSIVPDEPGAIREAVQQAAQGHDLVLLNAGSSAGSEDYTAHIVEQLGELLVHGVALRPGHPVVLGMIAEVGGEKRLERPVPIIGVPGYPVSAALTGEIFVEPLLAQWQGQVPYQAPTMEAVLTRKLPSHTGDLDYVRVAVGQVGDRVTATPISRGAGIITSLVRADGIVKVPRFSEGLNAGSAVTVHLYRSPDVIRKTIVAIGSHDLTLDLLSQHLAARGSGLRLSSANVGSLGGLLALRRREAHLAGSHLLDPESGTYNVAYVQRYLPEMDTMLVTLVGRQQGWIVAAGNPKAITGWEDAARDDLHIVNRQRGAGTRVLLDYHLSLLGISPETVHGYEREEFTHLAVAAAVSAGTADAGPGIRAAANALKLDFVPLALERYDLVIPAEFYESDLLQPLLNLLQEGTFRRAVAAMPGYDINEMGVVQEQAAKS